jgi:hypothetical protein
MMWWLILESFGNKNKHKKHNVSKNEQDRRKWTSGSFPWCGSRVAVRICRIRLCQRRSPT